MSNFKLEDYIFIHKCEYAGCDDKVSYDDEPYCFNHSPDSGSSVPGYSAKVKAGHKNHIPWDQLVTSLGINFHK